MLLLRRPSSRLWRSPPLTGHLVEIVADLAVVVVAVVVTVSIEAGVHMYVV